MEHSEEVQTSELEWLFSSPAPWRDLVAFGPSLFGSYAVLSFLECAPSSPAAPDQPKELVSGDPEKLQVVLSELRRFTRTPDECYLCYWDGNWGLDLEGGTVGIAERMYFFRRGHLSERGEWILVPAGITESPEQEALPAFIWPKDRSWCVAIDVDSDFAGIGASAEAIVQLGTLTRVSVKHLERNGSASS
ncbi:hypothetical protein AA0Z99_00160 [Agrococcus sp. 1P02AA]|uniref:hypothetical protein n=1 Tax=Agrococcus sp. 1P02AA TaxID=3132259 RepID=UPI0039A5EFAF